MDKNTITTPITNIIQKNKQDLEWYMEEYLDLYQYARMFGFGRNLVEWFKRLFGKQNYCFTNSRRLWVWEKTIGNRGWRAYVGNGKGICFEVHNKCSHQEAMDMAKDFLSSIKKEMNDGS